MNKFTNMYLHAVDSSLAIHLKNHREADWFRICSDLAEAVRALNQESDPEVFRNDWTPEELAQRQKMIKPLTLHDLQKQVNEACDSYGADFQLEKHGWFFISEDFEIRRRK
jgi:hypothetical protein